MAKKTITFHILQNTGDIKKTLCCNPPLDPKLVFLTCFFERDIDVEQKQNVKSGKIKDKEKEFERKKKTGNQKRERIGEKAL